MSNADKLESALEALLFEHEYGPDFITSKDAKCPVEEAKKALASYRASKLVTGEELVERLKGLQSELVQFGFGEDDCIKQAITRLQAPPNPWCYDMEKAPKVERHFIEIAYIGKNEERFTAHAHWTEWIDGEGFGWTDGTVASWGMEENVRIENVYAWRLMSPPPTPPL